jgi:hypothetical protein
MAHPIGNQRLVQPVDIVDFHQEIVSQFEATAAEVRRAVLHADDLIEVRLVGAGIAAHDLGLSR